MNIIITDAPKISYIDRTSTPSPTEISATVATTPTEISTNIATPSVSREPSYNPLGNLDIIPSVIGEVAYSDNIFRTQVEKVSSVITVVKPSIIIALETGPDVYSVSAEVDNGIYASSTDDNYTDWTVAANANFELNTRHLLGLNADFRDAHEDRGTGFSEGELQLDLPNSPDRFRDSTYNLNYQFGTDESRGRVVLGLENHEKKYTNNRQDTFSRDREDQSLDATFFLGVIPKADILFQYRHTDINYDFNPVNEFSLNSEEDYAFVGLAWEATANTTGSIKFGYGAKDFNSTGREDVSAPSWEVGMQWLPLSYSKVTFTANRDYEETNGIGNAIQRKRYDLIWQHAWSGRLSSVVTMSHENNSYDGALRKYNLQSYSGQINYSVARWMDIRFGIRQDKRGAELVNNLNYDSFIFTIGVEAVL